MLRQSREVVIAGVFSFFDVFRALIFLAYTDIITRVLLEIAICLE